LFAHNTGVSDMVIIRMTSNDLECVIRLKVRFMDGTLGVRLLRVSDSTTCIDVARGGGGGVGWRA